MPRTSLTHPLRIDALPVPGTTGLLGLTLCPGKIQQHGLSGSWRRDLDVDLRAIRDWGATLLVTLMQAHELDTFQVRDLPSRVPEGLQHLHLPIPDGGVPDAAWEQAWSTAGAQIRMALKEGRKVVLHCLGGLGRTGTVAARLLVEFGLEPRQAMAAVRKARPDTIENARQEAYVLTCRRVAGGTRRPRHPIEPGRASRFRGCLLGGAVGDALGAPVEFMDLQAIHAKFGPGGVRDFAPAYGGQGRITDDTQMTLFTAEGMLRYHVRLKTRGVATVPSVLGGAYQRWLLTQGARGRAVAIDGWLFGHQALFAGRAPGATCLSALQAMDQRGGTRPPANDSKGCGGIMRVAPIGLYVAARSLPPEQAFLWGCDAAALTHGHPTGQLAAGVLAMLIALLAPGRGLQEALAAAKAHLREQPSHGETLQAMEAAEGLAAGDRPATACLASLGQGWVAEEALALSLFCALRATSLEEGVILAVNLTGDSDSTGAITGNLLGALRGAHELPDRWLAQLELRTVLEAMADDLATVDRWALAEQPTPLQKQEQAYWVERYPGS